ncbi:MAG: hypothetical protein U0930_06290 [Pirellulales bacterium]
MGRSLNPSHDTKEFKLPTTHAISQSTAKIMPRTESTKVPAKDRDLATVQLDKPAGKSWTGSFNGRWLTTDQQV